MLLFGLSPEPSRWLLEASPDRTWFIRWPSSTGRPIYHPEIEQCASRCHRNRKPLRNLVPMTQEQHHSSITATSVRNSMSNNQVYPQLQRLWCTSASIYHTPSFCRLPSAAVYRLLLAATKLSPALLGVKVVVPVIRSVVHLLHLRANEAIPVNGPVHDVVAGNERGSPVENLGAEAPPGVEDGVVGRAGQGELAVRGDAIRDDALLLRATCGSILSDRGSSGFRVEVGVVLLRRSPSSSAVLLQPPSLHLLSTSICAAGSFE